MDSVLKRHTFFILHVCAERICFWLELCGRAIYSGTFFLIIVCPFSYIKTYSHKFYDLYFSQNPYFLISTPVYFVSRDHPLSVALTLRLRWPLCSKYGAILALTFLIRTMSAMVHQRLQWVSVSLSHLNDKYFIRMFEFSTFQH